MPRFALLEDEIADVSSPPLSIWNKAVFAYWCVYGTIRLLQEWPTTVSAFERAAMVVFVLSALATGIFVLLQRDKSRLPRSDESVADYRVAYLNEFERQYGIERRAIMSLVAGVSAGMALHITGGLLTRGVDAGTVFLPVAVLLSALIVLRIRRVHWTRGLNRLRHEIDNVQ